MSMEAMTLFWSNKNNKEMNKKNKNSLLIKFEHNTF